MVIWSNQKPFSIYVPTEISGVNGKQPKPTASDLRKQIWSRWFVIR